MSINRISVRSSPSDNDPYRIYREYVAKSMAKRTSQKSHFKPDPCTCTTFGGNFGEPRFGTEHVWVPGKCWPRLVTWEVRRYKQEYGWSDNSIAYKLHLKAATVRSILEGRELPMEQASSWMWVDSEEPGFPDRWEKRGGSLLKQITQRELWSIRYNQMFGLGWHMVFKHPKGDTYCVQKPIDSVIIKPQRPVLDDNPYPWPWSPYPFSHRVTRWLVNKKKWYKAFKWDGPFKLTNDGRILYDSLFYRRLKRGDKDFYIEGF